METLFQFLIKASAGIILFYTVYWFFLRNETFYLANRVFLLFALATAVLLPLFPVQYVVFIEQNNTPGAYQTINDTFKNIPFVGNANSVSYNFEWQHAILFIYLTGFSIFLLRLLSHSFVLIHLIITINSSLLNGMRIVENEKYGLPFSFFNVIFINPKFHTQDDLPEILAHEKVHIRENHWFDLLFIELLTVIFWFNPFIWFFERSIKQNHEYLADQGVLLQGHGVGRYQAILLNQLMGMQIIGVTNNLNFALNTNRLKMMTKKKTSVKGRIKFIWTLPVLMLLLFAFSEPNYKSSELLLEDNSPTLQEIEWKNPVKMTGLVLAENGDPLPGTSVVIKGSTIGTVSDIDGKFKLEVPENATIVLSFVGLKTTTDTYKGITSASKKDGVFNRKYMMKDAISTIFNNSYDGDYKTSYDGVRLPPPPPQPSTKEAVHTNGKIPPPPPVINGEEEVFYIVEAMPHFQGGNNAMQDYISKKQLKIAQTQGIKGKAKVLFTVNTKGKVSDIKIVEKDNDDAAKGATLLVSGMPDWTPGKQRGKPVSVKYLLPVEFK